MRFLLFFSCYFFVSISWSQTPAERAESAYRQQESTQYVEAINSYEALLNEGYTSADLHFNLGMAYYSQQQLGKAILYLEKAYRIKPYDRQINKNLELLRNEQADGLLPIPTFFLKDWWNKIGARLSPDSWGILALLLVIFGCAAVAARSWYRPQTAPPAWYQRWQKRLLPLAALTLTLSVLFVLLAISRQKELARADQGIVTATTANLYIAPDETTDVALDVHEGLRARIQDEFEGWYKLSLSDGREGWVKVEMVERI